MTFNQLIILLIVAILAYFLFKLSLVILIIAIIIIVIYYVISSVNNEINPGVSYENMGVQHFKQVKSCGNDKSSKSSKSPSTKSPTSPTSAKSWYSPVQAYYQNSPNLAPNSNGLPDKSSAACVHKCMCETGDLKSALKKCKSPMPGNYSPKSKFEPEGITTDTSYVSAFSDDIFDDSNTDAFDKLCSK